MFVYARLPIDFWDGWMTEAQYLNDVGADTPSGLTYECQKQTGFVLAKRLFWRGDIREGPFVSGLPTDELTRDGKVIVAWKQDHGGETFIVSPVKLPWLEDDHTPHQNWISI